MQRAVGHGTVLLSEYHSRVAASRMVLEGVAGHAVALRILLYALNCYIYVRS